MFGNRLALLTKQIEWMLKFSAKESFEKMLHFLTLPRFRRQRKVF